MSNELQQKYRKFYEDPHLWIDAPIQLQCIEKHLELKDDPRSEVSLGSQFLFDAEMYNAIWLFGTVDKYLPLFKPQEGEAFIKDLEACLQETVSPHLAYSETENGYYVFFSKAYNYELRVPTSNISKLALLGNLDLGVAINTAAYVDTMRSLGYYL
jgi:hypothetical protein